VLAAQPNENDMPAYLIVQGSINDEAQYQKYREAVVPLITSHGGRFLVRGGKVEVLEGTPDDRRPVIFEFPSMAALQAFWDSPDYVPVKKLRQHAASFNVWAVEGV
jgi:uncharacterized protein (DUF1330 family)